MDLYGFVCLKNRLPLIHYNNTTFFSFLSTETARFLPAEKEKKHPPICAFCRSAGKPHPSALRAATLSRLPARSALLSLRLSGCHWQPAPRLRGGQERSRFLLWGTKTAARGAAAGRSPRLRTAHEKKPLARLFSIPFFPVGNDPEDCDQRDREADHEQIAVFPVEFRHGIEVHPVPADDDRQREKDRRDHG